MRAALSQAAAGRGRRSLAAARRRSLLAAVLALVTAGGVAGCQSDTAHARRVGATPLQPPSASPSSPRRAVRSSPPASASAVTPLPEAGHGLPPVIGRVPVNDRVVFITIDDGWEKDADFVSLIAARRIPLTLFLANMAIKGDYAYFAGLQQAGALIEDHTMTHPYLPRLSYARQKQEICTAADTYALRYGTRPTLLRAPYGATDHETLRAARDCGMRAILFWREVVEQGRIAYQLPGGLHPGDIILAHFDPGMKAGFERLLQAIEAQGFTPASLRDYLPASYFR